MNVYLYSEPEGGNTMWKKIFYDNKETNYSVSDIGEVRKDTNNYLMKLQIQQGYKHVTLQIHGKAKRFRVHRLVAEAFIPNPENKPYVNHIDGNRQNNNVSNLEWVTPQENTKHAVSTGLMLPTRQRAVVQFSLEGEKIAEYISISEAARQTNSSDEKICICCQLQREQHNGFQWRYKNESGEKLQQIKEYVTKPKKVAQIDPKTNEVIAIYDSMTQAAKAVGGTQSAITHVIKGDKSTKTHKGYGWKLVEDIVQ